MGCWICVPTCGKCKPASMRAGLCPECGNPYYLDTRQLLEGKAATCESCGADITQAAMPQPEQCYFVGEICAAPCGKAKTASDLGLQKCGYLTPVE